MNELLPCPFCGGEADEYEGDYGNGIYCMMCGAMVGEPIHLGYRTMERVSIDEAIAAWNSRAELGSEREAELQKALNKAAGNWAKADAELRNALDFMRIWISEDAHLGESAISREFEKAEGLRKLDAIEDAFTGKLNSRAERTCHNVTDEYWLDDERFECSECGAWMYLESESLRTCSEGHVNYCYNCGARVVVGK